MSQIATPKLQVGVNMVQVWLVTGHNLDRHDIRCGGSELLGPYMWVVEEYKHAFAEEMKKRHEGRFKYIHFGDCRLVPVSKIPTLEQQIEEFETYLKKPLAFPPIGDED